MALSDKISNATLAKMLGIAWEGLNQALADEKKLQPSTAMVLYDEEFAIKQFLRHIKEKGRKAKKPTGLRPGESYIYGAQQPVGPFKPREDFGIDYADKDAEVTSLMWAHRYANNPAPMELKVLKLRNVKPSSVPLYYNSELSKDWLDKRLKK